MGQSRRGRSNGRPGHVRYALKATDVRFRGTRRDGPKGDAALVENGKSALPQFLGVLSQSSSGDKDIIAITFDGRWKCDQLRR